MIDQLILASGSEIRARMLQNAGVIFTRMAADIDEESIKTGMHKPLDVAARLAELKAGHVSGQRPGA